MQLNATFEVESKHSEIPKGMLVCTDNYISKRCQRRQSPPRPHATPNNPSGRHIQTTSTIKDRQATSSKITHPGRTGSLGPLHHLRACGARAIGGTAAIHSPAAALYSPGACPTRPLSIVAARVVSALSGWPSCRWLPVLRPRMSLMFP